MSSSTSTLTIQVDRDYRRVVWLTLALFLSYFCVAMSLPVMSIHVATRLGFGNVLAGLAVGIAFASTILTHGVAGRRADHRASKSCVVRGLWIYALAGLTCVASSWPGLSARRPMASSLPSAAGRERELHGWSAVRRRRWRFGVG